MRACPTSAVLTRCSASRLKSPIRPCSRAMRARVLAHLWDIPSRTPFGQGFVGSRPWARICAATWRLWRRW